VNSGLRKTFDLLAATRNEAAVPVLVAALDCAQPEAQEAALRAILERRSLFGQTALVRRLHEAGPQWRDILRENQGGMAHALRDAVLDTDRQMALNGCQAILWFREYDLMPALVNALEDEANPNADLVTSTLMELADLLYEELAIPRDDRQRRDPQRMRALIVGSLELSVQRYVKHRRREVLEVFLMLAPRENGTLRHVLSDPHHSAYLAMVEVLLHSDRPSVMRLLLSFLEDPHPPSTALTTLARRNGRKFVAHLLRKTGLAPPAIVLHNLKRIDAIPWSRPEAGMLEALDDAEQHSLVLVLQASAVRRNEVYATLSHLARLGRPGGRRAALRAMSEFRGAEANQLVVAALDDEDPQVQAEAVRQLRQRGVPGSMSRLIDMAESRQPAVREAVREALAEFRFPRFLNAFDLMDDETRRSTGALVLKIDPQAPALLVDELKSPLRTRRLRAVAVAVAMADVRRVERPLRKLLADEDHIVRIEAVRALAACDSEDTREALLHAAADKSVLVRQAARQSLDDIRQRLGLPPLEWQDDFAPPKGEGRDDV